MGFGTKAVLFFGGGVIFFMLLKDNSIPKLVNDAAAGARDLAGGLRPVTTVT